MKSLNEFLDSITAIQAVHDEESLQENIQALYAIGTPKDDPTEMGETFKETIGYDPITYYDEKMIREILDSVIKDCQDYPQTTRRLQTMADTAVKFALRDLNKQKKPVAAKSLWGFINDQLSDVGEMSRKDIIRLEESFNSKYGVQNPRTDIRPKKKSMDFDMGSDDDELVVDEDFFDDEEY